MIEGEFKEQLRLLNDRVLRVFESFNTKLERVSDTLNGINTVLAQQTAQLGEHMRRTEAAEKRLEILHTEMDPLKKHVSQWSGIGKALAVLATAAGIFAALSHSGIGR